MRAVSRSTWWQCVRPTITSTRARARTAPSGSRRRSRCRTRRRCRRATSASTPRSSASCGARTAASTASGRRSRLPLACSSTRRRRSAAAADDLQGSGLPGPGLTRGGGGGGAHGGRVGGGARRGGRGGRGGAVGRCAPARRPSAGSEHGRGRRPRGVGARPARPRCGTLAALPHAFRRRGARLHAQRGVVRAARSRSSRSSPPAGGGAAGRGGGAAAAAVARRSSARHLRSGRSLGGRRRRRRRRQIAPTSAPASHEIHEHGHSQPMVCDDCEAEGADAGHCSHLALGDDADAFTAGFFHSHFEHEGGGGSSSGA